MLEGLVSGDKEIIGNNGRKELMEEPIMKDMIWGTNPPKFDDLDMKNF